MLMACIGTILLYGIATVMIQIGIDLDLESGYLPVFLLVFGFILMVAGMYIYTANIAEFTSEMVIQGLLDKGLLEIKQ